jgi:hypothetical protein
LRADSARRPGVYLLRPTALDAVPSTTNVVNWDRSRHAAYSNFHVSAGALRPAQLDHLLRHTCIFYKAPTHASMPACPCVWCACPSLLQVAEAVTPDLVIFVMDGSIGQAAFDQARAFKEAVEVRGRWGGGRGGCRGGEGRTTVVLAVEGLGREGLHPVLRDMCWCAVDWLQRKGVASRGLS